VRRVRLQQRPAKPLRQEAENFGDHPVGTGNHPLLQAVGHGVRHPLPNAHQPLPAGLRPQPSEAQRALGVVRGASLRFGVTLPGSVLTWANYYQPRQEIEPARWTNPNSGIFNHFRGLPKMMS